MCLENGIIPHVIYHGKDINKMTMDYHETDPSSSINDINTCLHDQVFFRL